MHGYANWRGLVKELGFLFVTSFSHLRHTLMEEKHIPLIWRICYILRFSAYVRRVPLRILAFFYEKSLRISAFFIISLWNLEFYSYLCTE